jgi:hypothetical protein
LGKGDDSGFVVAVTKQQQQQKQIIEDVVLTFCFPLLFP